MKQLGVVVLFVVGVVLGQTPASAGAFFPVSGSVTVPAGYDATAVSVLLQYPNGSTYQSTNPNAGGAYSFASVANGSYTLLFAGPSLQGRALPLTVVASPVTGMDVTLVRMVKLSGTIASDRGPVTQAWLSLWDTACTAEQQRVAAYGSPFTTTLFPGGSYRLLIEPLTGQGVPTWNAMQQSCAAADVMDLSADRTLSLTVSSGGAITGRLSLAGQPVGAGWTVNVYAEQPVSSGTWAPFGITAVTAADSSYRLSGLPNGTYKVMVPGSRGTDVAVDQWYPTPITISGYQTVTGVDLNLVEGGQISGITTGPQGPHTASVNLHDATSGNWLGGVVSAADGTWTITGLAPGDYKLEMVDTDGSNREYFDNVKSLSKARIIHIEAGTRVTGITAWLGADEPVPAPTVRTLRRTPAKVKVGKKKVLPATTVQGEALTWKTTTTRTCQVTKTKKVWRVKGKSRGTCKLQASAGTQWSTKVRVRVG